jgi:glycine betaine catabolism A
MNEPLLRLFRRLIDELDCPESVEWDATESSIDPAVYSSDAHYQRELDGIFRRMPLCLGHAGQLPNPGDMIAREVIGLPLLIVRDRDGDIGVFLNVCRHRGSRLVVEQEQVCHANALSCPYHAWTYDLHGALRSIPGREGFPTIDRSERGLRRFPSVVRHGLIWVGLDPDQPDLDVAGFLGDIDDDLTAMDLASHRFYRQHARVRKTNWKLVMDAFQEVYHISRLHAKTIAPFFLERKLAGEGVGLHTRLLVGRDRLREAVTLPPDQWDLRNHVTLTHVVFPNSLIIYHPDSTSHLAMLPSAPDEILFVHTMLIPHEPRSDQERAHWERNFDMIDEGVFGAEDLNVSEQIQKGLCSGANETFVFGRFEQHLRRFHENVASFVAGVT